VQYRSKVGDAGIVHAWQINRKAHPPIWIMREMTTGSRQIRRNPDGSFQCVRQETGSFRDCEDGSWLVKTKRGFFANYTRQSFERLYAPV
jgi:hypothetical protein